MKKIIVMGHGGYAKGIKENLEMIVGQLTNMYFIDLTKEDDLSSFENKVKELLESFHEDEVIFTCDLLGASPFRAAAMLCVDNPGKYYTLAGLNTAALIELSMESDLPMEDLVNRAIDTTKMSVARFPD